MQKRLEFQPQSFLSGPISAHARDLRFNALVEADLHAALRTAAQEPDRAGDGGGDTLSPAS